MQFDRHQGCIQFEAVPPNIEHSKDIAFLLNETFAFLQFGGQRSTRYLHKVIGCEQDVY